MKVRTLIISALSILLMTGCTKQEDPNTKYSKTTLDAGFDTFLTLQEWCESEEVFLEHFTSTEEMFKRYNDLFDIYHTYEGLNNIKTINDNAGKQPVEVDEEIINLLKQAKQFYELSNGEFDITQGALFRVWHNYREKGISDNSDGVKGKVPSLEELQEARSHGGWENVVIDEENNTVFLTDEKMRLDVGGIAKGYATEQIAKELEKSELKGAAVNAGGNNRTLGDKYDGTPWKVRIQNPNGGERMLIVEKAGAFSFVTSGDYERYYIGTDDKKYHHIIDPNTLYPSDTYRSVTIITQDSGVADCLSTTLFTLSIEEGKQVINKYKELYPDTFCEAIWILDNDSLGGEKAGEFYVIWTEGLEESITLELE